jgi:Transcriptional regulator, AbiEi antitoxin
VIDQPEVLTLFGAQYGVATSNQLLNSGMSRRSITRAQEHGALIRVLPGLYRLAGYEWTFECRAMTAQLHCGPRSFLDGATAGSFLGLRSMPRGRTRLSMDGRVTVRVVPPWMAVAASAPGCAEPVVHPSGLRIAHPLHMLRTLATEFSFHRFERAAEDAWHLGLVSPAQAAEYLERIRRPGVSGVSQLDRWLGYALPRQRPSQSGLELDALAAIRLAGLPEPVRQHPLELLTGERIHLDIAWPNVSLAVEPGHSWWHGGDLRMSADYERDRACGEVGWHVVRFDQSMREDLRASGQQLRRLYDARRRLFPL